MNYNFFLNFKRFKVRIIDRRTINNIEVKCRGCTIAHAIIDDNLMPPSHNRSRVLPLCSASLHPAADIVANRRDLPKGARARIKPVIFWFRIRGLSWITRRRYTTVLAHLFALVTALSPRMYLGVEFRLGLYHHEHIFARTKFYFRLSHVRPPFPRDFIALLD